MWYTVEPRYNEDLGTMKILLLYQVSHYIRVKRQRNIKSWDQQNHLVIRGFCYIRPLYNKVPLYKYSLRKVQPIEYWFIITHVNALHVTLDLYMYMFETFRLKCFYLYMFIYSCFLLKVEQPLQFNKNCSLR